MFYQQKKQLHVKLNVLLQHAQPKVQKTQDEKITYYQIQDIQKFSNYRQFCEQIIGRTELFWY